MRESLTWDFVKEVTSQSAKEVRAKFPKLNQPRTLHKKYDNCWELQYFLLQLSVGFFEIQQASRYQHVFCHLLHGQVFHKNQIQNYIYLPSAYIVQGISVTLVLEHTPQSEIAEDAYGSGQGLYLMQGND